MISKLGAVVVVLSMCSMLMSPAAARAQDEETPSTQVELDKVVPTSLYTQSGFAATKYAREFAKWKARFIKDRHAYLETSQSIYDDPKLDSDQRQMARLNARENAYVNSIDRGKKGQSFIDFMTEAMYAHSAYATRAGTIVGRLIDNEYSRAVGYGGTFESAGRTVELWYVVFNDMKAMKNRDLRTTSAFSVFSPLRLPKLNETLRDSWPSMVFIRDQQGRLMLWGMSAEQQKIITRSEEKSMY